MTEDEAKTKRCPFSSDPDLKVYNHCVASDCMMWTWRYIKISETYKHRIMAARKEAADPARGKIQRIKEARVVLGTGLRQSKEIVEDLEADREPAIIESDQGSCGLTQG